MLWIKFCSYYTAIILSVFLIHVPFDAEGAEIEIFDGLEPGQRVLLIRGPINTGDDDRFYELSRLAENAVVFLESPGGDVDAGLAIGAEIAIRGFSTQVVDGLGCHSICAVIWLAGKRRYMNADADISVHAAYRLETDLDGGVSVSESGVANSKIGAFLNELGLSYSAVQYFTLARPNDPLLPVTPAIAQALDIDVYVNQSGRTITPTARPGPRRIIRQVSDYVGMATNCGELYGVDPQLWIAHAEAALKQGHALFGAQQFEKLVSEYASSTKDAVQRDGVVRWCLAAETSLRSDGLSTEIPGPSFECALASTPTEYAICGSEQLWALDRAMANIYFFYMRNQSAARSAEFRASQRAWLQRRDACGTDLGCLIERHSSRLFDFGW